jgi:predicted permease
MPDWGEPIRGRLARLNLSGAREGEVVEELAQHLEDRYQELRTRGVSEEEARHLALTELQEDKTLEEQLRKVRLPAHREPAALGSTGRIRMLGTLQHDLKIAFRATRSKPAFSLMVIGMLAAGVAGNAAIFSVFNGLFLRPLPFAEPDRLVDLDETAPKWNLKFVGLSCPDFYAWREGNKTFDSMAFFDSEGYDLSDGRGGAQHIRGKQVTRDMLDVLRLKPALGRNFLPEEDRHGGPKVLMLGYALWQRMFQGDRTVLGRVLKLNGEPYTVVGVLPREAVFPPDAELWTPLAANVSRNNGWYLSGVGRLKRGVTIEQAAADLLRVHRAPNPGSGRDATDVTSPTVMPLRDRYLGDYRQVTHILLGGVAIVLLIACVNIAGLMLVRGAARTREIAICRAIGASRGAIIRQLLTESLVLAAIGGIAGVLIGHVFLRGILILMPDDMPGWLSFRLDATFAAFCTLITAAAAVLFGLAPAIQAAGVDPRAWLQDGARSSFSRGRRGALSLLIVCEVGLALMQLVSAGLLLQAFRKVTHADPGFRPDNVLTYTLDLPEARYPKEPQQVEFYRRLLDRLRVLPGVQSAGAVSILPLDGHTGWFFKVEGGRTITGKDQNPVVLLLRSTTGYFETRGVNLLAGRRFDERDGAVDGPKVAIVSESFAKYFWPNTDAMGKRIRYAWDEGWMQVIGITRDVKHYGLDREMRPSVWVPFRQQSQRAMSIALRSAINPHSLANAAREVQRQIDPDLAMFNIRTMSERLDRSLWARRAYSWLFGAFAAVAILLAAAGVYGVTSYAVSQRSREIGIRMALGARPTQVMSGVLLNGMALVSAGVVLGLIGALLTTRLLESLLFGVSTHEPVTYACVIAGLAVVGLLANFIPAQRASRVDPMRILRFE